MMIETAHLGSDNAKLEKFLKERGYSIETSIHGQDTVFVKA